MQVKKNQFEKMEDGLARARAAIREAAQSRSYMSYKEDFVPTGSVYINPYSFHQLSFSLSFVRLGLLGLTTLGKIHVPNLLLISCYKNASFVFFPPKNVPLAKELRKIERKP